MQAGLSTKEALDLVQVHLGGDWLEVTVEHVVLSELKGGASSKIYVLEDVSSKVSQNGKLIIRLYAGGKLYDPENDTIGRLSDSAQAVLAFKLGELGHGPCQLAFFQGGRIEEFVENRCLTAEDLDDPEIVEQIARKVAIYHGMDKLVPTTRKPRDAFIVIRKHTTDWSQQWLRETLERTLPEEQKAAINWDLLMRFDFETELTWIAGIRHLAESPLVHAHYDLNSGNTLIRESPDRHGHRVMLVDYEGACMEQRGFDISTHFNFHLTDSSKPGFRSGRPYPSEEYRRNFITFYLDEWKKNNELRGVDTVDHILWESDVNGLLHVMFLLSWWIVPGEFVLNNATLLNAFLVLAQDLLLSYFERKARVIQNLS
jgi:thiamine kinase-like enzyme